MHYGRPNRSNSYRTPDPAPEDQQFTDLDDQLPPSVSLPADQWVEVLKNAKVELEDDGAEPVFTTWRVEEEELLDVGNVKIADSMPESGERLALNASMTTRGRLGSQRAISF